MPFSRAKVIFPFSHFRRESEQLFHRQLKRVSKANKRDVDTHKLEPRLLFQEVKTSTVVACEDGTSPDVEDLSIELVDDAIIFVKQNADECKADKKSDPIVRKTTIEKY